MEIGVIGNVAANNVQRYAEGGQANVAPVNPPSAQTTVQTVNAVQQAVAPPSMEQLKQAVDDINKSTALQTHGLVFSIDGETEKTVVKVIDQKTDEVIRQIPSEEVLAISASLDKLIGQLINKKA